MGSFSFQLGFTEPLRLVSEERESVLGEGAPGAVAVRGLESEQMRD